jgi:hypothetical protein
MRIRTTGARNHYTVWLAHADLVAVDCTIEDDVADVNPLRVRWWARA